MIPLKKTSKKNLFLNFIAVANFDQFGMLCNFVYLTTENKQTWHRSGIVAETIVSLPRRSRRW